MSVLVVTKVLCDECGASWDDGYLNAKQIRQKRKNFGWIQLGSKDYCEKCATNHTKTKGSK